MTMTKKQMTKRTKRIGRKNRIARERNIQRNAPPKKYRLDVKKDDKFIVGVKFWSQWYLVERFLKSVEDDRAKGEKILQGKIVDSTGEVVAEIAGDKEKGSLPDKIADGPKTV